MDIPATITALNATIQVARGLAATSAELDKAELKMLIVNLVDQLVETKDALVDAKEALREKDEEIRCLKEAAEFKGDLIEYDGFQYKKGKNGEREGQPYCPNCQQSEEKWISLQLDSDYVDWRRFCPQCKTEFVIDKRVRDESRRDRPRKAIR